MAKRWQPPPMGPKKTSDQETEGAVKVDEQVVRNVLKVNPNLRDGRTTFQVKKALERGEGLTPGTNPTPASQNSPTSSSDQARQLGETLDFFMTTKQRELTTKLDEIAERRRLLDEEEQGLRGDMKQKLVDFACMLDAGILAIHGKEALAPHRELLAKLGITSTELLDAVKRGGR
ncbi:MAG: hypothetical protein AAF654_12465 [Myxococcota bacterium]